MPPGMSKNAAKKLARKQKFEATKHERRLAERLKKKENKRMRSLAAQNQLQQGVQTTGDKRRASTSSDEAEAQQHAKRTKPSRESRESGRKVYFDARLVIDCGFDQLMTDKEASSMTQQLMYLYSANRNANVPFAEVILTGQEDLDECLQDVDPAQLSLVPKGAMPVVEAPRAADSSNARGIENNRIGQAMDGKLRGVWRRWKRVTIYKAGGIESLLSRDSAPDPASPPAGPAAASNSAGACPHHFASEQSRQAVHRIPIRDAIYLTADTDDTLTALEPGKTYIIGGIVDKNRYKGLCRAKADRLGIRAAKLPLSQEMLQAVERNVRLQGESIQDEDGRQEGNKAFVGRKVLTVNQVVEILTAWTETRDWVTALEKALPRRKLKQRGPAAKSAAEVSAPAEDADEQEDAARNGL